MSAAASPLHHLYLSHADLSDSSTLSGNADPDRVALLSEYLSLQPTPALCRAQSESRTADVLAARIKLSRDLDLSETSSEKELLDHALEKCNQRALSCSESVRDADELRRRQHVILSVLYPSHPLLDPVMQSLAEVRERISTLRIALRDQSVALTKLTDAANLLLLISDHVEILTSCYANSCTSSSSDLSCEDDAVKIGCLGRSDEPRSSIYISSVPSNYRIRYLRKCWGLAADAVASAVGLSSYLARHLEKDGTSELVRGIDAQSRPSLSLFELPGGLTVMLRSDMLQKMSNEAKAMRETVRMWQHRQRKFISRIRKDLAKTKKNAGVYESRLADLRENLLSQEFAREDSLA